MLASPKAVIFGCSGLVLLDKERALFERVNPVGFILFARNIDNPKQVKKLVDDLKSCVSHEECLVLIDQEGGRVARLKPPHWPAYPKSSVFADRAKHNLGEALKDVYENYRNIGQDLIQLGINVDCAPVLDIPVNGADKIIGDRAFGNDPEQITILGRAACDGLRAAGVMPIMKHIPGHGRANVDSHLALPVVEASIDELERTDFLPFKNLSDIPMAMTAHVKYSVLDKHHCATMSYIVVDKIRNNIGFNGLLMSDDLSMKALSGSFAERTKRSLEVGCDVVLHCNGEMDEMLEIASALPEEISQAGKIRLNNAFKFVL